MAFHIAKHKETGRYLSAVDENGNALYSDNYDDALWNEDDAIVQNFLDDNNIEDAQVDEGGNNPPKKPPF